ncbi:MAG: hypothetical protein ACXVLQ_13080 [Bacteriovorax sp.]
MKRSLILMFLLFAVACKNTNETSNAQKKMPFENNAYLSLPHAKDQSVLRRKLLNLRLTKMLNQKDEVKLASGDEFQFLNDQHSFNENEKIEYEKYKATCAEIIVSFKDHLEFYFVPTGINRDNALLQLDLKTEKGSKLFWVTETPAVLTKGQSYYLMSASDDEIRENDVNFYQQKIENQGIGQSLKFTNNQKITMDFKIDYLVKQTSIGTRSGGGMTRCSRDMNEAGLCGACQYKIEALTGALVAKQWQKSDFGLAFNLNGLEYPLEKFDSTISEDGHLIVEMDLRKVTDSQEVSLEVLPLRIQKIITTFKGFDFEPTCRNRDVSLEQDLTPVIHSNLMMQVKGRVLNF